MLCSLAQHFDYLHSAAAIANHCHFFVFEECIIIVYPFLGESARVVNIIAYVCLVDRLFIVRINKGIWIIGFLVINKFFVF